MVGWSGSPGAGHSSTGETSVEREERWLRVWAFGVSPQGLGLSAEALWHLTPREYVALKRVWAEDRALFMNAHFSRPEGDPAFSPEDFVFEGSREARKQQVLADRMDVARINMRLQQIQAGPPGDDIPSWARKVN